MTTQIAVLGGGYAGVVAAHRLARQLGRAARVTLVTERPAFVQRIRLHELTAGRTVRSWPLAPLVAPAEVVIARVRAIDPAARTVETDRGTLRPDAVVYALGSRAARTVPGAAHALALDGPDDAAVIAAAAARGGRLAIVGGGLTAIELAAELAEAWPSLRVSLIARGALGGAALGPRARAHVEAALAARAVEVIDARVDAIEPGRLWLDGAAVAVDAAVLAIGFVAAPLAAEAGLPVDGAGRLLVDDTLAAPGAGWLWAAGDGAVPRAPVGAPVAMGCKTAMPMATRAADNLAAVVTGRAPRPWRFGDQLACVSLGRRDGVIQRRAPDGGNRGVVRGRVGAWIKERVCRFTIAALTGRVAQASFALYDRRGAAVLALPAASPS